MQGESRLTNRDFCVYYGHDPAQITHLLNFELVVVESRG